MIAFQYGIVGIFRGLISLYRRQLLNSGDAGYFCGLKQCHFPRVYADRREAGSARPRRQCTTELRFRGARAFIS